MTLLRVDWHGSWAHVCRHRGVRGLGAGGRVDAAVLGRLVGPAYLRPARGDVTWHELVRHTRLSEVAGRFPFAIHCFNLYGGRSKWYEVIMPADVKPETRRWCRMVEKVLGLRMKPGEVRLYQLLRRDGPYVEV